MQPTNTTGLSVNKSFPHLKDNSGNETVDVSLHFFVKI